MYTHLRRQIAAAFALAALVAPVSSAQTPEGGPDPATVRVRVGALWMNPTISVPNVGIDTNVFNDPPTLTPKRDFTITVVAEARPLAADGPDVAFGDHRRRYRLVSDSIRASVRRTTPTRIGWKAPLNRLVLATSATWLSTKERPGFEIDARAPRKEPSYDGSVEIRGFAKSFIGIRGGWTQVRFDESAEYRGVDLQEQLDRTATSAAVTFRHQLTPLTGLTFSVGRSEERFKFATSRDSTMNSYSVGLSFDPAALIKGSATFGYSSFKPESSDLPGYDGSTADVNVNYTLLGSTRFALTVRRAVEFSYDIDQPYYVLTGGSGSIAQQIFGPLDMVARGGTQRLFYTTRVGATVPAPDRTDRIRSYGFGLGIHMGQDLRLGFNLDKERRTSVLSDREYDGLKYGSSVTYGVP